MRHSVARHPSITHILCMFLHRIWDGPGTGRRQDWREQDQKQAASHDERLPSLRIQKFYKKYYANK